MQKQNRCRTDIVKDILRECKDPKRKTHIVYRCNLNFTILEPYLKNLIEYGLLRTIAPLSYIITEKGLAWLKAFQKVQIIEGII